MSLKLWARMSEVKKMMGMQTRWMAMLTWWESV